MDLQHRGCGGGDGRAQPGMACGMALTRPSAARKARAAPLPRGYGEPAPVSAVAEAARHCTGYQAIFFPKRGCIRYSMVAMAIDVLP